MIGPWLGAHLPVFGPDPVNRAHPVNDGLVTWWLTLPPTDGGLRWYDLLGLNHGTLANFGAGFGWRGTTRPGGFGHLAFDATLGSEVDPASAAPFPSGNAPRTYALWSNTAASGLKVWFDHGDPNTLSARFLIYDSGDGHVTLEYHGGGVTGTRPVTDGAWHHVAVTYDGATVAIYVDGTLDVASTLGAALATAATLPRVGNPWPGPIDDFRAYNRALSAVGIKALYDASRAGYTGVLNRVAAPVPQPTIIPGAAALVARSSVTAGTATKPAAPALQAVAQATGLAYFAVAYEGSGTTLHDLSAAADHATVPAGIWGTGPFSGPDLVVAGDPTRVAILPSTAPLDQAGDFSISCRVKLTGAGSQCFLSDYSSSASFNGWAVGCDDAGSGKVKFYTHNDPADDTTLSATALSLGVWHHVACTFDAATGTKRIYLDNALDATSPAGVTAPAYGTGQHAGIGGLVFSDGTTVQQPTTGELDAVAVYNYVLPASGGAKDSVAGLYADPFVAVRPGTVPTAAALAATATVTAAASPKVPGAASLAVASTLTATARLTVPGTAAPASVATLAATGRVAVAGSASLAGASSLAPTASLAIPGATSSAAASTLTATAGTAVASAAALGATSALTATGRVAIAGAASLVGSATLTAVASLALPGTSSPAGVSSLTAAGSLAVPGLASIAGGSTLTAGAGLALPGTASLTAASGLTATAGLALPGASAFVAASTLTATGKVAVAGAASLAGRATLVGSAAGQASAALSGSASLAATPKVAIAAAASLAGSASLTPAASLALPGAAALASTTVVVASATTAVAGAAPLGGSASLTATGRVAIAGAVALVGASALTAGAGLALPGVAALGGSATLIAGAGLALPGTAALAATSSLATAAGASVPGASALAGAASLTATGRVAVAGAAALSGVSAASATARLEGAGASTLAGVATLTSAAGLAIPGAADLGSAATLASSPALPGAAGLNAAAVLVAIPSLAIAGAASIAGTGTLGASARLAIPGAAALAGAAVLRARLKPAGVGITGFASVGRRRGPDPQRSAGRGK